MRKGARYSRRASSARSAKDFEIGGHTVDHVRLIRANLDQIGACKQRLEQELGGEVAGFCYPGGHHDATIRAAVAVPGFATPVRSRRGPDAATRSACR